MYFLIFCVIAVLLSVYLVYKSNTEAEFNLYVGDGEPPVDDKHWIIVNSLNQFIECIEIEGIPSFVSFPEESNPLQDECFNWLIQYCKVNEKPLPSTIQIRYKDEEPSTFTDVKMFKI